jgi:uncharacterized protein
MATVRDFKDKWALVTGASAGIGAALARELARHGAKLILTARRKDRLEALAAELTALGAEVRVASADLNDPAAAQQIFDATEGAGVPVDILINNAGLGQYGAFVEGDVEQELSQVRVNCEAMVRLTRLFVPRMVERRRGWVLVVASMASFQPVPYLTTYAATKAFDRFFALGLAAEVARFNVKVTALCPGRTESEFFEVARASRFRGRRLQPAEQVAAAGIAALARGERTIIPYFRGRVTSFMTRFIPVAAISRLVEKVARPGR